MTPEDEGWLFARVLPGCRRVEFRYDAAGNASGNVVGITPAYDNDDLLTQAGALTLTRDPSNGLVRATSITSGTGTVTDASDYTSFGELQHYVAKYNGTPFFEQTYSRDTLGRITSITETQTIAPAPPATTVKFYKYDAAGRLWRVCPDDACTTITSEYLYDPNGNRLAGSFNQSGMLTAAVYDAQDRLISTQSSVLGPQSYSYTANGEEQTKTDAGGQSTYTYDALGNLRRVVLPDATQIDYVVDGRNRRIGKKVTVNNATVLVRQWLYEDQLEPVAELDGQGNVVAEFVHASKPHAPDYMKNNGQIYRIISDQLGSVRLVVNVENATIAQRLGYDPFGSVTIDTNPAWQSLAFAGGQYDPDTELSHFGARDYDSQAGRWMTKDPFGLRSDPNLYPYVGNDPVNFSDPTGADRDLASQMNTTGEAARLAKMQTRLSDLLQKFGKNALCLATSRVVNEHHLIPEFSGVGSGVTSAMNPNMHNGILHPLLNGMLRSIGLPGSYAASGSAAWPDLIENDPVAKRAFGIALIASAEYVDRLCRGVAGYGAIAPTVRGEVLSL